MSITNQNQLDDPLKVFGSVWNIVPEDFSASTVWNRLVKQPLQNYATPFVISITTTGSMRDGRIADVRVLEKNLTAQVLTLQAPMAILFSFPPFDQKSLPEDEDLVTEALTHISMVSKIGVPIFLKIGVLANIERIKRVTNHPACSGIVLATQCEYDLLARWIYLARISSIKKHINVCACFNGPVAVWRAYRAGADSISLDTATQQNLLKHRLAIQLARWLFR
jgi:hypothetical protein